MVLLSELSCPWPLDIESCQIPDMSPEDPIFVSALATASAIMTRLSAYTVGTCEVTVRPLGLCRECRTWCCGGTDALYLKGPFGLNIWDVLSVSLGPDDYPPNTWRYDREMKMLFRVPPDRWPTKDERWSNPNEGEAFSLQATIGTPPDAWALDVLSRLVKELVLSCTGSKCRLPSNTTTVTSQGITVRLRDLEINTFIPELAAWVNAVNPHHAHLPGAVFSPDLASARMGGSFGGGGGCCGR